MSAPQTGAPPPAAASLQQQQQLLLQQQQLLLQQQQQLLQQRGHQLQQGGSSSSTAPDGGHPLHLQPQTKFSVKFFDFSVRGLYEANEPFVRVDFDKFKSFQSDKEKRENKDAVDLESGVWDWGFRAGFIYTTRAVDKMPSKKFKLMVYDYTGPNKEAILLGTAEVDLRTLACGPQVIRLSLLSPDPDKNTEPAQIEFTCLLKMISSDFAISLQDLKISIQGWPAPAKFDLSSTLREDVVVEAPFSENGSWESVSLQFETTLWDLMSPFASVAGMGSAVVGGGGGAGGASSTGTTAAGGNPITNAGAPSAAGTTTTNDPTADGILSSKAAEGLKINVKDESGYEQGQISINFRDYLKLDGLGEQAFDLGAIPITYGEDGDQVGELNGKILFQNLPKYGQMVGGMLWDDRIEGNAQLLCLNLPYPDKWLKKLRRELST
eukprot:g7581.t1